MRSPNPRVSRRGSSPTSAPRSRRSSFISPAENSANNMRAILTLLRKGFLRFLRNRTAVVLTFVVPIGMIYIFGQVFGLGRKDTGPSGIKLAVVNASPNPAAQKLVD